MAAQGVIYSDFDGVHNVPERTGLATALVPTAGSSFFREETTIRWDREILELFIEFLRVSNFVLEWLTTWNEHSLIHHAARGMEFPHIAHAPANLDHKARGSKEWTAWKARHIITDQRRNPRPFIWIDDKAPHFWREVVEQSTSAPSLIIATDSISGLTKDEILQMVLWLERIRSGSKQNNN